MSRDMRIVNMSPGQLAEYDKVFKRQGEIAYRDIGVLSKIALFNSGKALITEGLRVVSGGGMVVTIPTGSILQRITSGDILPCISTANQSITLDAASGSPRTDIIECQVKSVTDKDDTTKAVLDPTTGVISLENIKRDLKYYLATQKKTGSTDATAATAGVLSGTVGIAGTIDLSANYLLNIADGEDGSFQEIDLRGSTPEATTRSEIINAINTAIGRTIASTGAGDTITLTGYGTGETSYFEIKPPVSNSDADALQTVFGVSGAGVYNYIYKGVNDWIKLCEIDIGASTTVITGSMIRNIDQKATWASDSDQIKTRSLLYSTETELLPGEDLRFLATYKAISPTFPWFCMSLPDQTLSVTNYPQSFIDVLRAKKVTYDELNTNVSSFSGTWSGSEFTLDDTVANNAMLAELAEEWLFAGSPTTGWRILVSGGSEYNITNIVTSTRKITVSGSPSGTSIEIYLNRILGSTTSAKHFSWAGLGLYMTGQNKITGLRRRDKFQGWQLGATHTATTYYSRIEAVDVTQPSNVSATYADIRNGSGLQGDAAMYTAKSDGTNGDPRTGPKTEMESGTLLVYMYTGGYTA